MIGALFANWRILLTLLAPILLAIIAWGIDGHGYDRGYAARVAEEATIIRERTDAANRADDDARRCAADPACRLSNDGWRRD